MRVGVTGASGFVGRHLLNKLSDEGYQPVPFEGDLLELDEIRQYFDVNSGVEVLVHLAGVAMGNNLSELIRHNVVTTDNLLSVGTGKNLKKVVLASSAAVYGHPVSSASKESDPLRPNSPYGLSKLFAEEVVRYYHTAHGLEYVTLRFSPIYGPGNQKGVIHSFLQAIEERGEISIDGEGTQRRNFLHVDDACASLLLAIEFKKSDVFNVANPRAVSVNDVAKILSRTRKFKVIHRPANFPTQDLLMDTAKACQELGFEPTISELTI